MSTSRNLVENLCSDEISVSSNVLLVVHDLGATFAFAGCIRPTPQGTGLASRATFRAPGTLGTRGRRALVLVFRGAAGAHPNTAHFLLDTIEAGTDGADEPLYSCALCEVRLCQVPFRVVFEAGCTHPDVALTSQFNTRPHPVFTAFNQRDQAHKTLYAGRLETLGVDFSNVLDSGDSPVQVCSFSYCAHPCSFTLLIAISQQAIWNQTGEEGVVSYGAVVTAVAMLPVAQGADFRSCPRDRRHDICTWS